MPLSPVALVRPPSESYVTWYGARDIVMDPARVAAQHAGYVRALESAGAAVRDIALDEAFPDGVFIEDTAVVWGNAALITRMVPRREGEQAAVMQQLRRHGVTLRGLPEGATLEGGDVLHAHTVTYVGRSERTNEAGVEALGAFLAPFGREVVAVPVPRALHLKSVATSLGDGHLLFDAERVDPSPFVGTALLRTAPGEGHAANTLRLGNRLLCLAGYPRTEAVLRAFAGPRGIMVVPLEMSEFEKGDGSLTCLSIVL